MHPKPISLGDRIIAGIWRHFIFFRGSRETRQPRYKNKKNNKNNTLYRGYHVPRLPQSFSVTGVHDSRKKHFEIIFISRLLCFQVIGSRDTLYCGCGMVPHEVKLRLLGCRDLPTIIWSFSLDKLSWTRKNYKRLPQFSNLYKPYLEYNESVK